MSGDVIDLAVKSFYRNQGSSGGNANIFNDILTSLAGGIVTVAGETKGTLGDLSNSSTSPLLGPLSLFRSGNNPDPVGKPKAYLNWILLDEQFTYVGSYPQSGALPVGGPDVLTTLAYSGINITKSGYLYIYVSNETQNWDVFFDNLAIKQYTGPMLEETHYYPFGLTMAGISSKALVAESPENKYKFNGIEQNTDFDLNMYDARYRNFDPQIGRFWQIDPKIERTEAWSPYAAMLDNPIRYNDPLGDSSRPPKVVPLPVSEKKYPNIYKNLMKAVSMGHPLTLTYDASQKNARERRAAALKNTPQPKPGNSRDEYPFASTTQGGKGASVMEVPASENSGHGGLVGATVVANQMQTGDQFQIVPIPDNGTSEQGQEATQTQTQVQVTPATQASKSSFREYMDNMSMMAPTPLTGTPAIQTLTPEQSRTMMKWISVAVGVITAIYTDGATSPLLKPAF